MALHRISSRLTRMLFYVGWVTLGAFLFDRYCKGGSLNLIGALWPPYLIATIAWGVGAVSDAWLAP
jgi:hypothetical protein